MRHQVSRLALLKIALVAGAAAFPAVALGQNAQPVTAAKPAAEDTATDANAIIVTGFRQSLEAALNVKKNSVAAVDAIVAEDIAKFPDQNLAESLQRIPGISIQRDAGEGRAITVRGLGAQFTRVRLNGLETVATSTDGASSNRDRAFDFNVFASELFSSIVVHKTAEANLDEGSLGAVVDLNTGAPLTGKSGLRGALSLVGSYNDLSGDVGPRVAGLLGWKNDVGTFGASVSAAYSKTDTLELGNNSVRWAQSRFDSVNGAPCFYNTTGSIAAGNLVYTTPRPNSGGTYKPSAACDQATLAFHPRIPRYGMIEHRRERLGVTGSVQFAPSDMTKLSLDALYSRFKEDREEKWGEVLLRSNERAIDVLNPVYDAHNNLISATLNDVFVRTEHYLRQSNTQFYQLGGTWDQEFTDTFRTTVLGGFSKSNADIPIESTLMFDDRDSQGYKYDYTDMAHPVLTFGTPSVADPATFQLAEIRDRPSNVTNKFRTAQLRTEWDVANGFTIKAGAVYRRFDFATRAFTRDSVVCGNGGLDLVLGTMTCSPTSTFGPTAIYGFPVTAALSQTFNIGNAGQPAGTTEQFLVANLPAAATFTKLYSRPLLVDTGNTRAVREMTKGAYLEFDSKGNLFGLEYAANAGIRYVVTDQSSTGVLSGTTVTVTRRYHDWLPSINIALYPAPDVIVRGAVARVITRPTLGNLTPGGSVDGFNYRITYGNPQLNPYRATNFDLGIEWYFAPQAILSIAGFVKKVESFPVTQAFTGSFASTGLPKEALPPSSPAFINFDPNQQYTITANVNGTGATLKGVEVALQLPFKTFIGGFFGNFGVLANATFINSDATYNVQGPIVQAFVPTSVPTPGALGPLVSAARTATLFGVSKQAYNGTLYYDDGKFSARVSASYRSRYIDANSGTGNVFEGYGATTNLDASIRYKFAEWIELSVEGNNLLDTYRYRFTDFDADRNYENNHFGRTFLFGARLKI
ncbi:MAG: TonB-dependent receptor [Croceibacterium sp.]